MYAKLRDRFRHSYRDLDALQNLEQAGAPPVLVTKAIDAGLAPLVVLRLLVRIGVRMAPTLEEFLDEIDAAGKRQAS